MPESAEIVIETEDGGMPAYETRPDGAAKGGIVVIQEAFGVTSHIEELTRRLAADGWHAVAPALFHREGSPVMAYDDFAAVMPAMGALTAGGITTDLAAAFGHLEAGGFTAGQTGITGFCMGGSVTLYAATLEPRGAAVTFYGGGVTEGRFGLPSLIEQAPNIATPWLGLYGDLDQGIPVDSVEALRAAAAEAKVETEIVRYADADHGFNCNDRPAVYHAAAAADAWSRMLAWFDDHIGGS